MKYPYSSYREHHQEWEKARSLKSVCPKPEEGDVWIQVGDDKGEMALHLRVMHMLSALGCTPEERSYFGPRFVSTTRFIALNKDDLRKDGLFLFEDGERAVVTAACEKAVLECFEATPMPAIAEIAVSDVIRRGKELLKSGFTE